MARSIQVTRTSNGAKIKFPFDLKDNFRAAFKSAKWDPVQKVWKVGPRSIKRLEQWVKAVQDAADEIATHDEREFAMRDLEALAREVSEIREWRAAQIQFAAELKETLILIEAARVELAEMKAAYKEEQAAVADMRAQIEEAVSDHCDLEKMKAARTMMAVVMLLRKAKATEEYNESKSIVLAEYERAKAAGFYSDAIELALSANKNRLDRDRQDLLREIIWQRAEC
ncbi:MAG: hypothetical protein ABJ360_21640 [Roseobacter sp.]|uniref:hypothetical protein n=1 Tax=Tateyamaria sp. TaxID=1929288 RepID=UPI0032798665